MIRSRDWLRRLGISVRTSAMTAPRPIKTELQISKHDQTHTEHEARGVEVTLRGVGVASARGGRTCEGKGGHTVPRPVHDA